MKEKIKNLVRALNDVGINAEVDWDAEWYCIDDQTHYGIEIMTDFDTGEDSLSICFSPKGKLLNSCMEAPLRKG